MADRMCLTLLCTFRKGGLHVELARRCIIISLSLKKISTQVQWITHNHLFTNNVKYFIWYMHARGICHLCFHTSDFDIAGWLPLTRQGRDKWALLCKRHFHWMILFCILIRISLKFVSNCPVNKMSALVQIMACRRSGDKALYTSHMRRSDARCTNQNSFVVLFSSNFFRLVKHIWILTVIHSSISDHWWLGAWSVASQYLHQFRLISCHQKHLGERDSYLLWKCL